jgi:hypothetical protein
MATLRIEIRLNNAAFEGDGLQNELHSVLSAIQFKIATGQTENKIYDSNGNNVGDFRIVEDK